MKEFSINRTEFFNAITSLIQALKKEKETKGVMWRMPELYIRENKIYTIFAGNVYCTIFGKARRHVLPGCQLKIYLDSIDIENIFRQFENSNSQTLKIKIGEHSSLFYHQWNTVIAFGRLKKTLLQDEVDYYIDNNKDFDFILI